MKCSMDCFNCEFEDCIRDEAFVTISEAKAATACDRQIRAELAYREPPEYFSRKEQPTKYDSAWRREYRQKHKEWIAMRNAQYREKNKEKI